MPVKGHGASAGELRADLVFEGGGVKGIALAGAYRELAERGYAPQCVAGTSAGAITAALVAAGYSGRELEHVVLHEMRFPQFEDPAFLDDFGRVGQAAEFLLHRGMHSGDFFLQWISDRLAAKGMTKFGQLRDDTATHPNRTYRLQVIASDLSTRSMLVLPRDSAALGISDPDELEIAHAVRMSMSIPLFFEPVVLENAKTGTPHVVVDGGLLSNFPIWLFDLPPGAVPQFPTFGMTLVAPGERVSLAPPPPGHPQAELRWDIDFLKAIVSTMMDAHDRIAMDAATEARTIALPTLGVGTTDFAIDPAQARALFNAGRAATARFLDGWSFEGYIERFRADRDEAGATRP
ncbi:MAG TPA: patatin-like phospholipase family protein [Solirubrobacteraceae bacterium]|nr:patatin-like phospholipase family protein [Solirubrobacteraceae bacterium]